MEFSLETPGLAFRPVVWFIVAVLAVLNLLSFPAFAQGGPVRLNGLLVEGGDIRSSTISPDGAAVVYVADQDIDEVFELYSVSIDGGVPVKLNEPLDGQR
ncbi:MAG: hypothetical protein AAF736_01770, partial [Pseudomonadota bacterium]